MDTPETLSGGHEPELIAHLNFNILDDLYKYVRERVLLLLTQNCSLGLFEGASLNAVFVFRHIYRYPNAKLLQFAA